MNDIKGIDQSDPYIELLLRVGVADPAQSVVQDLKELDLGVLSRICEVADAHNSLATLAGEIRERTYATIYGCIGASIVSNASELLPISLSEQREVAVRFVNFLKDNAESIVQTGAPQSEFDAPEMRAIGTVGDYFNTKMAHTYLPPRAIIREGDLEPIEFRNSGEVQEALLKIDQVKLRKCRSIILDLKIELTNSVHAGISYGNPDQFVNDCIRTFSQRLFDADLHFRTHLDGLSVSLMGQVLPVFGSSLSWADRIVCYFAEELSEGYFEKQWAMISNIKSNRANWSDDAYFAVEQDDRELLAALGRYSSGNFSVFKQETTKFGQRFYEGLRAYRSSNMTISKAVPDQYKIEIQREAERFISDLVTKYSGSVGHDRHEAKSFSDRQLERFCFYKFGDIWIIVFDGEELPPVADCAGLKVIHTLLKRPREKLHITEFGKVVAGVLAESGANWIKDGLSVRRETGYVDLDGDRQSARTLKRGIEILNEKRQASSDVDEKFDIERQIEGLESELTKIQGKGGRIRQKGFEETVRIRIAKNITDLFKRVHHDAFRTYIRSTIKISYHCEYNPDKNPIKIDNWKLA